MAVKIKKKKSKSFQRGQETLEIIYKDNHKILDRVEYGLNNPKDKRALLDYIRQKLGLVYSDDDKTEYS